MSVPLVFLSELLCVCRPDRAVAEARELARHSIGGVCHGGAQSCISTRTATTARVEKQHVRSCELIVSLLLRCPVNKPLDLVILGTVRCSQAQRK